MTEATGLVGVDTADHVAVITLNRAEALNALSTALAAELTAAAERVAADPDVWVVVLTGEGDRAFCVGADLKERMGADHQASVAGRQALQSLFDAFDAIPQPTVAAVFGHTLGGGLELALCCDLIVAAEGTRLGLPETAAGLIPAGRGTWRLPRAVGPSLARRMIFTGEAIDAAAAQHAGLVDRVVPRDALIEEATLLARSIAGRSPQAVRIAKGLIARAFDADDAELRKLEDEAWHAVAASPDRTEGIAAFMEKRAPRWSSPR